MELDGDLDPYRDGLPPHSRRLEHPLQHRVPCRHVEILQRVDDLHFIDPAIDAHQYMQNDPPSICSGLAFAGYTGCTWVIGMGSSS